MTLIWKAIADSNGSFGFIKKRQPLLVKLSWIAQQLADDFQEFFGLMA